MAENSTYIKLDRNITEWQWFSNGNILMVWIYILTKTNYEDKKLNGRTIKRGTCFTSNPRIMEATGLTTSKVRYALDKLEETGEIICHKSQNGIIVEVPNYKRYQGEYGKNSRNEPQNQSQIQSQNINKERKESNKSIYSAYPPSIEKIEAYLVAQKIDNVDAAKFWNYYERDGWKTDRGTKIDWKRKAKEWSEREKTGFVGQGDSSERKTIIDGEEYQ